MRPPPPQNAQSPSVLQLHRVIPGAEPLRCQRPVHRALLAEPGVSQRPAQHLLSILGLRWCLHVHQAIHSPAASHQSRGHLPTVEVMQHQPIGGVDVINGEFFPAAAVEHHQRTPVLHGAGALHFTKEFNFNVSPVTCSCCTHIVPMRPSRWSYSCLMSAQQSMSQSMNRAHPEQSMRWGQETGEGKAVLCLGSRSLRYKPWTFN